MGLGYGAGAIAFIIMCFSVLLVIFVIPAWLYWNAWQKKQQKLSKYHPKLDKTVKWGLSTLLIFPIFVLLSYAEIAFSNHQSDRAYQEYMAQIIIQLKQPLVYGEVILPQGTWINRSFETNYSLEQMTDIRQGLTSARFPELIQIAGFDVIAFELDRHLLLELAHDHTVMMNNQKEICPAGWLLELGGSGYPSTEQLYSLNFDWFTPSRWQPINCFDGEGIIVLESKHYL